MAIRIGEAVTPAHYYFWHTTGTCGTFGAAAAAGKLLGLSRGAVDLGAGKCRDPGRRFMGVFSGWLHVQTPAPGKSGPKTAYWQLCWQEKVLPVQQQLLRGRGDFAGPPLLLTNWIKLLKVLVLLPIRLRKTAIKSTLPCRHTHPAVDLVLELAAKHSIRASDVAGLTVRTYSTALNITANHQPDTVYAAKFSLPFCVALALVKGSCGLKDFTPETLADPEIRHLMSVVSLVQDPGLDALHPARWPAEVEIITKSGLSYCGRTDFPGVTRKTR